MTEMGGKRWLLGLQDVPRRRRGDTAFQLAAYRYATHYLDGDGTIQPMKAVGECGVIWLRADGYELFLYCRELWRWQNDTSKTVVGEEIPPPPRTPQIVQEVTA
jgi:hypothetical protein